MRQLRCGSNSAAELMEKNAWILYLAPFVSWRCHRALGYLGCDSHEGVWGPGDAQYVKCLLWKQKRLGFDPKM